jgi:co-chaperonin GroES (HSP10)
MPSVAVLERLSQATDPKAALLKELGDLSGVQELMGARVLVALYVGPEKTKSGLYRPQSQVKEDIWQGCVGLIVKKGPMAFQNDDKNDFHGQDPKIGQWVTFRPGDGKRVQVNEVDCRLIEDALIDMVISEPEIITHK